MEIFDRKLVIVGVLGFFQILSITITCIFFESNRQTVLSSTNLESIFLKAPDLEQLFQTRKVIGKLNIQDVLKVLSQHFIPN
jgi:hypothetical protein